MWNTTVFAAPRNRSAEDWGGLAQWLVVAAGTLLDQDSADWVWESLNSIQDTLAPMRARWTEDGPMHALVTLYSKAVDELVAYFQDGIVEHLQAVLQAAFEAHRETRRLAPAQSVAPRRMPPVGLGRPMRVPGFLTSAASVVA